MEDPMHAYKEAANRHPEAFALARRLTVLRREHHIVANAAMSRLAETLVDIDESMRSAGGQESIAT